MRDEDRGHMYVTSIQSQIIKVGAVVKLNHQVSIGDVRLEVSVAYGL